MPKEGTILFLKAIITHKLIDRPLRDVKAASISI